MSTISGSLLFLTEGSVHVGTGHLRRCATLARYLTDRGWKTQFQVLGDSAQTLSSEALSLILHGLSWQSLPQPSLPTSATDLMIVDVSPSSQKSVVAWCHHHGVRCLALDYLQPDLLPDAVVTLKDHSGQMQTSFDEAGRPEAYHEGVAYSIMRPSIIAHRANRSKTGYDSPLNVLVSLGGADPQKLTLEAMDLLRPWIKQLARVLIVLGPGVSSEFQKEIMHEASPLGFSVVKAPSNFDDLLAAADLVLCNGGGTMLESLCLRRLVAVLPQTEAETSFADTFCQHHACVWARDIRQILETTEQERLEFAERAGSIVDGNGLDRLVSLITDLVNPTRSAHV